nr:copper homeostasis protein CutC [Bacteroidota bacterium]
PLGTTFNRAFDMTNDPYKAVEDLINLRIDRVLTSGQERTLEGVDLLRELVEIAGEKIIVMPGGGITERNIAKIKKLNKAKEFHVSGRSKVESEMT